MIVAIDGPAGAGKSTVARAVARALGFSYLDSGAMYRAVALVSLAAPQRHAAELANELRIELGERVLLDGRDVTEAIRTPEVSARASEIAADPTVRSALVAQQRAMIASGDWVVEGRDIGTVVVPDADVKVFLTASAAERARRRALELGAGVEQVLSEQRARDSRDSERADSPLAAAGDAQVLDTTEIGVDSVVAEIVARVAARRGR
jgi:cytidylate kinase